MAVTMRTMTSRVVASGSAAGAGAAIACPCKFKGEGRGLLTILVSNFKNKSNQMHFTPTLSFKLTYIYRKDQLDMDGLTAEERLKVTRERNRYVFFLVRALTSLSKDCPDTHLSLFFLTYLGITPARAASARRCLWRR